MFKGKSKAPSGTDPRAKAPTEAIGYDNLTLTFRVWSNSPAYTEDAKPWKCTACFQYLLEALDFIAYCQDRGSDVVFQSPAECKPVLATDRRVVFKPDPITDELSDIADDGTLVDLGGEG